MNSLKDYISTREASQRYGLSSSQLTRLLNANAIQGKKIGHDWLIYEPSLKEYAKNPPKPGPKPRR
jgi:excisionase family DNA binding protein